MTKQFSKFQQHQSKSAHSCKFSLQFLLPYTHPLIIYLHHVQVSSRTHIDLVSCCNSNCSCGCKRKLSLVIGWYRCRRWQFETFSPSTFFYSAHSDYCPSPYFSCHPIIYGWYPLYHCRSSIDESKSYFHVWKGTRLEQQLLLDLKVSSLMVLFLSSDSPKEYGIKLGLRSTGSTSLNQKGSLFPFLTMALVLLLPSSCRLEDVAMSVSLIWLVEIGVMLYRNRR